MRHTNLIEANAALWELHKRFVAKARIEPGSLEDVRFLALALGGEVGEVLNQVKKSWREATPPFSDALYEELGDVFSYWLLLVHALGVEPESLINWAVLKASRKIAELEATR